MSTSAMLDGKVVIVTGAGGGIGRDVALAAAAEGAKVIVNDIGASLGGDGFDSTPAQRVVAEIKAAGGEAAASVESVSTPEGAAAIVETAIKAFGSVDGVVNNAGIIRDVFFHKMSDDQWDAVIKVHLYGSYNVSRAAAAHFRQQQSGVFVHMTSTSGLIGNRAQANYSAAKLGIVGLSKSIALDMEAFGVRSNCIAPFAWSRMTSAIKADSAAAEERIERLKQMTAAKVAPLAVYLLSDAAAAVNAQIFTVRNNEISLISQPRPVRSVHRGEGWTPQEIARHAMPALQASFYPNSVSADIFSWDPV